MFTGLIQNIGRIQTVRDRQGSRLITIGNSLRDIPVKGASVAVDGVCLTVVSSLPGSFTAECYFATLDKTGLKNKRSGTSVHLEPALRLGDSLDGHLLQGHVSCRTPVMENRAVGGGRLLTVRIPEGYEDEFIPEGSVGLDGVSLTIASLVKGYFSVQLIGETLESTLLGKLKPGEMINLETDLLLRSRRGGGIHDHSAKKNKTGITKQQLLQWGYV